LPRSERSRRLRSKEFSFLLLRKSLAGSY